MFWAEMMMSHLPPGRAGMIVSKTVFSICHPEPKPLGDLGADVDVGAGRVALASKNSCGGYGMSEQTVSVPGDDELIGGTVAIASGVGVAAAR